MRKALITGASEGIGREFCRQLAKAGYQVTAVARNQIRLQELQRELPGDGHQVRCCDLANPEQLAQLRESLGATPYDLLVNNAGIGLFGDFTSSDLAAHQAIVQVNIEALVALSHAFLRGAKSGDALVNVSSTLAFLPPAWAPVYGATKAFVTSFSESLWAQNEAKGIYVMNLCPGATYTQFHSRASGGALERQPPKGATQTPEQVVMIAMRALQKRTEPTVISGGKNRLFSGLSRVLSRKRLARLVAKIN